MKPGSVNSYSIQKSLKSDDVLHSQSNLNTSGHLPGKKLLDLSWQP